jgi:RecB family exonuclease
MLLHQWLRADQAAALLPGLHTFESFVYQTLEYSRRQLPRIGNAERLLRVARAWQDVGGREPCLFHVRQFDRFIRDWLACGLEPPGHPKYALEKLVQRYCEGLNTDRRLDPMSSVRVLTEEVTDPQSWLSRLLFNRIDHLCFDGFHRLERIELELIAALSHRCNVLVWLVGVPGQASWPTLASAVQLLQNRGASPVLVEHMPGSVGLFSGLGRRLFGAGGAAPDETIRGLVKLEADDATDEVEIVAKRIKADYLASQLTDRPLRLSDIAVVLPGPAYDPLVREIFPRAGLEFNLAGRALLVSDSRPARVLTGALQLIHGQWRHQLLLDFLSLPLVRRVLDHGQRLYDLFQHRPRARQRLDYRGWVQAWERYLLKLRERIERLKNGELELPERVILTREEYVEKQIALADGMEALVASIKAILEPVADLNEILNKGGTLEHLVAVCVRLLGLLNTDKWLEPKWPRQQRGESWADPAVPWVEYEKDQQAYYKLLNILQTLPGLPENRLPLTASGQSDALGILHLALASETYQIKTADDAGVQLFELREIRGLRFRHIYALGLVDGQMPPVPEEGVIPELRRKQSELSEQLRQRETEFGYLFSQLFEAAAERLVLSYPTRETEQKVLPSSFLAAVERHARLAPLEPANLAAGLRDAASQLGRVAIGARTKGNSLTQLWPAASGEKAPGLATVLANLAWWQARAAWPRGIGIDSPNLLQALFADNRTFSPSELETYAACPFRYFGLRVLKLDERDRDQTRLQYGSLIHRVLQAFYVELRQTLSVPEGAPLPAIDGRHRDRLAELFDAEWRQLDDGTLPPDLKNLFTCEEGVLQLFLESMALIEGEHGNLLNEFVLEDGDGNPIFLGTDKVNRPVFLTGKVDRVDVHREDATRAIILDYKTGRFTPTKERGLKIADGRMLQLLLYGAAVSILRRELRVVGGAYVHLSERAADVKKAIGLAGELPLPVNASALPFDIEGARRKALELAGEIRAGNFSLTAHTLDTPHAECSSFCATRHACRHPDGYKSANGF